jgi:hypothetical protein
MSASCGFGIVSTIRSPRPKPSPLVKFRGHDTDIEDLPRPKPSPLGCRWGKRSFQRSPTQGMPQDDPSGHFFARSSGLAVL